MDWTVWDDRERESRHAMPAYRFGVGNRVRWRVEEGEGPSMVIGVSRVMVEDVAGGVWMNSYRVRGVDLVVRDALEVELEAWPPEPGPWVVEVPKP